MRERIKQPSLKGGVDARLRKCREATLVRADGVVRSAKSLGLKSFAELTTPSAALRRLRAFLLMPQPPLLFKEGNVSALKQSVNSFTRSQPWVQRVGSSSRAAATESTLCAKPPSTSRSVALTAGCLPFNARRVHRIFHRNASLS